MTTRKKLIEVALPLEAINKASARKKSIRHGHPEGEAQALGGGRGGAEKAKEAGIHAPEPFDRHKLPAFHDPFAGGGALPLEAQRLGLEAYASDLNPVAVLINKAMIEIPPKFAGRPPVNPGNAGILPAMRGNAAGTAAFPGWRSRLCRAGGIGSSAPPDSPRVAGWAERRRHGGILPDDAKLVSAAGDDGRLHEAAHARDLAYKLFTLSEKRKRSAEAQGYNALVLGWPELAQLVQGVPAEAPTRQGELI